MVLRLGLTGGQSSAAQTPAASGTSFVAGVEVMENDLPKLMEQLSAPAPSKSTSRTADAAQRLAMQHPNGFGHTGLDMASGRIVPHVASAEGRSLAQKLAADSSALQLESTSSSFAELERIKHDAIELTSRDVPGGETIVRTSPDIANDRVVISARPTDSSSAPDRSPMRSYLPSGNAMAHSGSR
ncbi:hypothetical protein AB0B50_29015 [Streptomyces sp. NPDC041068]|uniref:hypothetical protein n=1 Tax=Streptomyces sp. NPDC041068 TaxID=3155130 RepID=UPI0034026121